MGIIKELDLRVSKKIQMACDALVSEGIDPVGGCVAVAIDGVLRGGLPLRHYESNMRHNANGSGLNKELVIRLVDEVNAGLTEKGICNGEVNYFSNSSSNSGIKPERVGRLSNRDAYLKAKDLSQGECFAVLLLTKAHIACLAALDKTVMLVDGQRRQRVQSLSIKETAGRIRKVQKIGLVIEIK